MKVYRIKDQNISYKREQNFFFMKDGLCPLEVFAARSRRDLRKPCFAALVIHGIKSFFLTKVQNYTKCVFSSQICCFSTTTK